ncbi:MAG: segregation/condensation protein A [Candidatus Desulfofervidaceae bacterium]|nr:segregation/condensation protein A [Candidatus Desulfofervidaceae bacterium]
MSALQVKIEVFEGPLDLLLHLVRKHQVDIYDIPIAMITEQYLEYLRFMKSLNIDLASEYLLMAATLVHIKSRMLLASPQEEDPREEITQALIDYMKVKDMAQMLEQREILHRDVFVRNAIEDIVGEENFVFPSLFDLLDAFKQVIESTKFSGTLQQEVETIPLEKKIQEVFDILQKNPDTLFERLFEKATTKEEMIVTFLAILHMAKEGVILLCQASPQAPIRIKLVLPPEEKKPHLEVV